MRNRHQVIATAAAVMLAVSLTACSTPETPTGAGSATSHTTPPAPEADDYRVPSSEEIAALPEAKYDAVIPGLIPFTQAVTATSTATYHLSADSPVYGADRATPVARIAALNFLGTNTVVVPVQKAGDWTLILTPSRQALPSQNNADAPAQSSAWIRTSLLVKNADLIARIEVSLSRQTLTIRTPGQPDASFDVGVGAPETPTPTGVTGYLQARYLDPAQDETVYPIQLTSLHSAVADNPYGGSDGGLIGVHFEPEHTGQISHGCIRLPADAITAVNALPLGTLITITA